MGRDPQNSKAELLGLLLNLRNLSSKTSGEGYCSDIAIDSELKLTVAFEIIGTHF